MTGPAGHYWIAPGALADLAVGDELDVDPVTGETLTVTARDDQSVSITLAMPGILETRVYSTAAGVLAGLVHQFAALGFDIRLLLQ